jgi:D-xylose transport system substrate-binding protein
MVASVAALSLASCGVAAGGGRAKPSQRQGDDITVGVLMPDKGTTRYEQFDYPIIKRRVAELTDNKGVVQYANAEKDAKRQNRQLRQMVADKVVDVLIVDAVDSKSIESSIRKAKDAGIPVIAYDRLAQGPIDAYVSFDNELVGEAQGRALVEKLGNSTSTIIMMNGSTTDPNAAQFRAGAMEEFQGAVTIAKTYDTKGWDTAYAKVNMEKAIAAVGLENIDGVYAANDGIAGVVIDVLKTAGVSKVPPVTGQDADLAAVQRIVSGDQYMTVYKPYVLEANAAAEMAVAKVQGRSIEFDALTRDSVDSPTNRNIPARLVQPIAVTRKDLEDTVVEDQLYTVEQICTAKYRADCEEMGLR